MTIPFNFDAIPTYFRKHGWLKPQKNGIHLKRYFFLGWCFSRCQSKERVVFHDHKEIRLEPFEFIFGRSTCSEETGISEQTIRTMINQLNTGMNGEILKKSTSKSTSKFTVYKWSAEILSENTNQQNNQQVTSNQPATNHKADKQTLDLLDIKESNIATESYEQQKSIFAPSQNLPAAPCLPPLIKDKKNKEESCEMFMGLASINGYEFKRDSVAVWLSKHPIEYLMSHLHDMIARNRLPDDFHAWFSTALSKNYVAEKKRTKENLEFIQSYVKEHRASWIKVHKKYCTLELGAGAENYYYENPSFQVEFLRKIENLNEYVG